MNFKAVFVILLITFSSLGAIRAQEIDSTFKPFNISSSSNRFFAFVGTYQGEYRVLPDKIELNVRESNILLRNTADYNGRRRLSELRACLASAATSESGRWDIKYRSAPVKLDKIMNPGENVILTDLQFTIPKDSSVDLAKYWLVFETSEYILDSGEEKAQIRGTAYAHSSRNIFGKEPLTNTEYKEDCISYDTASLEIVNLGEKGWRLTDGRSSMLILNNETDANAALALAKKYNQQCFIGRDNKRQDRKSYIVSYWK